MRALLTPSFRSRLPNSTPPPSREFAPPPRSPLRKARSRGCAKIVAAPRRRGKRIEDQRPKSVVGAGEKTRSRSHERPVVVRSKMGARASVASGPANCSVKAPPLPSPLLAYLSSTPSSPGGNLSFYFFFSLPLYSVGSRTVLGRTYSPL